MQQAKPSYLEIFLTFLKLGATGFGGPVALIALLDRECRERKQWVSVAQFNEAVLFCKLLPGPLAYQVALWVGKDVGGVRGGLLACLGFLLPGFTLILLLAIFYDQLRGYASFDGILLGIRSSALVVILFSVWKIAEPYRREARAWVFAALGALWMYQFPAWEPVSILLGGLAMVLAGRAARGRTLAIAPLSVTLLLEVFWVHFKAGMFVYGTGVAVLPFLQQEAVNLHQWMTHAEFLDGIAFGQITPGPLTIASAFIGYRAAGVLGAAVGTFGMYLPGMLLVLCVVPLIHSRLKGKRWLEDFQRGAMPVVIGGILGAWATLVPAAMPNWPAVAETVFLIALVLKFPKLAAWLIMGLGGILGLILQGLFG